MTKLLQFASAVPSVNAPVDAPTLGGTHTGAIDQAIDESIGALATFDAERLETLQAQIGTWSAKDLAREFADDSARLPELLRKHTLLGEMLNATAANLRVVAAVLEARGSADRNNPIDRSKHASWPR